MEHEMILLCADFKTVCARLVARRKKNAGMAEKAMHLTRNEDHSGSIPDTSPRIEERE